MISRRNIRVKVMQTLYTLSTQEGSATPGQPAKLLLQHFSQTRSLLFYLTWYLTEVARYAETDSHQRASKHLPTAEDLRVNTKIAGNELLWKILEEPSFRSLQESLHPGAQADRDLIKRIYGQLVESPAYHAYIASPERDRASERSILEFILNDLLLANEAFTAHIEELYSNWDDDGEMVVQLLAAFLQKPGSLDFEKLVSAEKEQFALSLLKTVLEKDSYLQEFIVPKLKNWDPERIAHLDMIMMKMGVAEFLFFETIPPKVTINEYIDLAKEYSTAQSGQFVNGILDNIHKDLVQSGQMQKTEFRKK